MADHDEHQQDDGISSEDLGYGPDDGIGAAAGGVARGTPGSGSTVAGSTPPTGTGMDTTGAHVEGTLTDRHEGAQTPETRHPPTGGTP